MIYRISLTSAHPVDPLPGIYGPQPILTESAPYTEKVSSSDDSEVYPYRGAFFHPGPVKAPNAG